MFCGECRAENAEGLRWCTSCGADLQAQRTPSGATPRPTPAPGGTIGGRATELPLPVTGAFEEGAAVGPDGRYTIREELGRGGMGLVYRATDGLTGEDVALKVMLPSLLDSDSAKKRFASEAALARKLTHPNVVRVHGPDAHGELQLLVMECLEGRTLRDELKALKAAGEPMAVKRAAEIARQCCAALEHAHGAGVLHRDVKPENVFLEEAKDGEVRVKLLDFGIARALDPDAWSSTNLAQGTAGYVAPEVLQGGEPSERSDLYSLGVVLYECLTGLLPAGRFEDPSEVRPGLSPAWDELLGQLLAQRTEVRPRSARAVAQRLRQTERGPASREPESTGASKVRRRARRAEWIVAIAGVMALIPIVREKWPRSLDQPTDRVARAPVQLGVAAAMERRLEAVGLEEVGRNDKGYAVYLREADGARTILIPDGEFSMGSLLGDADEVPVRRVRLGSYFLDETEVSRRSWVSSGRSLPRGDIHQSLDHPVVNVSWSQASSYCESVGGHLPTEEQWEYAARGSSSLPFPWGREWAMGRANGPGGKDGYLGLAPVGSFPDGAGPFGHLDLAGNAQEWTADLYPRGLESGMGQDGVNGVTFGGDRILRGGSFADVDVRFLRGANRARQAPSARSGSIGFRCASEVP